jgi:transposase
MPATLQRLIRLRMILAQALAREKQALRDLLRSAGELDTAEIEEDWDDGGMALLLDDTEYLSPTSLFGIPATLDPTAVALTEPFKEELGSAVAAVTMLTRQVQEMDRTIVALFAALPMPAHPLALLPGLPPIWIAGLWAEIGSITRFADADALMRYAGLDGKGRQVNELTTAMATRAFNPFLRVYLLEATKILCRENSAFRQIYAQSREQGCSHQQAIEQAARHLVRQADGLMRAAADGGLRQVTE